MIARSKLRFPSALGLGMESMLAEIDGRENLSKMLAKAGMTEEEFRDPDYYYDGDQVLYFLRQFRNLPKGVLPIHSALKNWSWSSVGILALAAMSSKNLRESIEVAVKYTQIYVPIVSFQIEEDHLESKMLLSLRCDFEEMNPAVIEVVLCAMKLTADEILTETKPCTVHFEHSTWLDMSDAEAEIAYQDLLNCEVKFSSTFTGIKGASDFLQIPVKNSNAATKQMATEMLQQQVSNSRIPQSLGERVKLILHEAAEAEEFLSLNELAEKLHMTQRTLIRKLSKEDLQFKNLLNEVRFKKAKTLLETTHLPVNIIAQKIGYQDSNAFIRAFKNQVGATPRQWRERD